MSFSTMPRMLEDIFLIGAVLSEGFQVFLSVVYPLFTEKTTLLPCAFFPSLLRALRMYAIIQ